MYLYVNEKNEIKSVNTPIFGLTGLYVDEDTPMFPFTGWSEAKICCYKVNVQNGVITMMTPYVDSRLLDHFDQVGLDTMANAESITDTQLGLADTFEAMESNQDAITVCEEAIVELYEMIMPEV